MGPPIPPTTAPYWPFAIGACVFADGTCVSNCLSAYDVTFLACSPFYFQVLMDCSPHNCTAVGLVLSYQKPSAVSHSGDASAIARFCAGVTPRYVRASPLYYSADDNSGICSLVHPGNRSCGEPSSAGCWAGLWCVSWPTCPCSPSLPSPKGLVWLRSRALRDHGLLPGPSEGQIAHGAHEHVAEPCSTGKIHAALLSDCLRSPVWQRSMEFWLQHSRTFWNILAGVPLTSLLACCSWPPIGLLAAAIIALWNNLAELPLTSLFN